MKQGFQFMMVIGLMVLSLQSKRVFADSGNISITIDSLSNVSGNGALEACGTAVHPGGIKPVLVTIRHDQSFYTVLTAPNNKWCVVFKRWTFDGKIEVSATTLRDPGTMKFQNVNISNFLDEVSEDFKK